jgi:cyclopropane-fatty-acyl-phospholipid synthase
VPAVKGRLLMERWLKGIVGKHVRRGTLEVSLGKGRAFTVGDGSGKPVAIAFDSAATLWWILSDPDLRLGEAYMDGSFRVTRGSLADFLDLVTSQNYISATLASLAAAASRYVSRRVSQFNPRRRARKNVHHHYDLDGRLYSLFLDADRQYSCAYFEGEGVTLDDAQIAKKRHLAAKLVMDRPGLRVLDIGSGWGGLGLYLSEIAGAKHVTGITLSDEQVAAARARVGERGLNGKVEFRLQDYRDVDEAFDRIVSVGMFEHVGVNHYGAFFRKIARLLKDDGVAMLHSIGRMGRPSATSAWIKKYIFPGGYIPSLSEVIPQIERSGLVVTDVEILRLHYAETLKAWRERFLARREEVSALYDERFCRMWEFYLAASEIAFRHQGMMVFQIQLAHRQQSVPLTRDYIGQAEERLRAAERRAKPMMRLAGE